MFFKGNIDIPLLYERYDILVSVSEIIKSKLNGNFYQSVKHITVDFELLDFLLSMFPCFKDTRIYKDKKIYFYKLAQLAVSDILHIREIKENMKVDYSNLVGCADYKIPQVLRYLNILEYDQELSELVDNKNEIQENSIYEIEIRANMIVAIDKIKMKYQEYSAIEINDLIWLLGQTNMMLSYHRTRTTSY